MRGLYLDESYSLKENPLRDYWKIMDNSFTGYNREDEKTVNKWLQEAWLSSRKVHPAC